MQSIVLGRSGICVSAVGLGGIQFAKISQRQTTRAIRTALDLGINFLETAHGYWDSEKKIGTALRGKRQGVVLASKSGPDNAKAFADHINESLRRMRTEFIDIYPSLCELAGLPLPEHLEGRSFVPLLKRPDMAWNSAAIGRYRTGDTIRTADHRYTSYSDNAGRPIARMLYDHRSDAAETANLSERPAQAETVGRLHEALQRGMGKPNR